MTKLYKLIVRCDKTQSDLARAADLSKASVSDLVARGVWPRKQAFIDKMDANIRRVLAKWGVAPAAIDEALSRDEPDITDLGDLLRRLSVNQKTFAAQVGIAQTTLVKIIDGAYPNQSKFADRLAAALRDLGATGEEINAALNRGEYMYRGLSAETMRVLEITRDPFHSARIKSPDDVMQTLEHEVAVKRMRIAADEGELLFLIADPGVGKTTAVNQLEMILRDAGTYDVIRVIQPDTSHLRISAVTNQLADSIHIPRNLDRNVRAQRIRDELTERSRATNLRTVVIIDNGHSLPDQTLIDLKQLWDNLKSGYDYLVGFIVVCQSKIENRLAAMHMREVNEHVVKHTMRGLTRPDEIRRYLEIKLGTGNDGWCRLFDDDVPDLIYDIVMNRPVPPGERPSVNLRWLNVMLCACLEKAVQDAGSQRVDAEIARRVFQSRAANGYR